jgi:hypothetical protein
MTRCASIGFSRKTLLQKPFIFSFWRRLHKEELYALYSSPNIIRDIKSRKMKWAGHVALPVYRRRACRVLVEGPEVK